MNESMQRMNDFSVPERFMESGDMNFGRFPRMEHFGRIEHHHHHHHHHHQDDDFFPFDR